MEKDAVLMALCPPGTSLQQCFTRYTTRLLHLNSRSKRFAMRNFAWEMCAPGEYRISCFDQYIDNVKLLKKASTKRSLNCQPGQDRMQCFDQYISTLKLNGKRSSSLLCPPGDDQLQCFDRYVGMMRLRTGVPGRQCKAGDDTMYCLSSYIRAVKRRDWTYTRRLGLDCMPADSDMACLDQYVNQVKLRHPVKRDSFNCGPGEGGMACFDRYAHNLRLLKKEESKRAADFQCSPWDDDLSCLDRYVTDVKLKAATITDKRSFECGPGDDRITCIDKYVDNIKLQHHVKHRVKRDISCAPGENDGACFDRYINELKLKVSKRFAQFECSPGENTRTCFDRYVGDLKLKLSKRLPQFECLPDDNDLACIDRYINNMKLRESFNKRASPGYECEPGSDGTACFDRYVHRLKTLVPTEVAKRHCSQTEDAVSCFNSYVADIKLHHHSDIKRSPISCPPGHNELDCFDAYIAKLKLRPVKRCQGHGCDDGDSLRRDQKVRDSSLEEDSRGRDGRWCGPNISRVQCFKQYVQRMLGTSDERTSEQGASPTDVRVHDNVEMNAVTKRNEPLCPVAMDTVQCFHQYLTQWVQQSMMHPKRTFKFGPGKRQLPTKDSLSVAVKKWDSLNNTCLTGDLMQCVRRLMLLFVQVTGIDSEEETNEAAEALCGLLELPPSQCIGQLQAVASSVAECGGKEMGQCFDNVLQTIEQRAVS